VRSAGGEIVGGLSDVVALGLPAVAAVFASAPDGITIVDDEGRWVYANPAACALLGRPLSKLRGQFVLSGFPVGDRASLLSRLSEQVAGTASEFRGVVIGADGLEREILASTFAIELDGRMHSVALLRDVTAARTAGRAAAALSQAAAQLTGAASIDEVLAGISRHAVEGTRGMVCAVVVVGDDHVVSSVGAYSPPSNNLPTGSGATRNAAWETLAGYTGEELAEAFSAGGIVIGQASREPVVLPDARSVWAANPITRRFAAAVESLDWQAAVFAPLSWEDRVFGWLSVFLPSGLAGPSEAELAFYTALADQAAVAVTNARLTARARDAAALMERARLARDLHDSVSQALFSMTMHARAAQLSLASAGLEESSPLGQAIGELIQLTRGAMAEMRALIFELRPGALAEEGLVAALRKQAAALTAREEVAIAVDGPERRLDLDAATEEHLYRIVSEALHNIVKHARAGRATVTIADEGDGLRVEVRDDGVGFDPELGHPGHLGLLTMAERSALVGAELTLASVPGAGTTITVFRADGKVDGDGR
jgi:PAS domain S-box-containing protein